MGQVAAGWWAECRTLETRTHPVTSCPTRQLTPGRPTPPFCHFSSPTRQLTPGRAHPAFLSLLLSLLHCSCATSWSNYVQIKNIFFFKTMLKVKIILRVSYRHMFFSRPNQIQLDLNSPNFELLRRYSLL